MISVLNRNNRPSLILNIALAVGATVVMNGFIFILGWNTSTDSLAPRASFSPPDWVVGVVWAFVLFPLMATSRWMLNEHLESKTAVVARDWVNILLFNCLIWPLYTLALGSLLGGLLGNILTVALTVYTISKVLPTSRLAALILVPVILWVSFATAIISVQMRLI